MNRTKLEVGSATAIASLAAFSIHQCYTQHAGSLNDARQAAPNDYATRMRLYDADMLTGGLVLLVGGTVSSMTKRVEPLALSVTAFAVVSLYYHYACKSEGA